jgi:very-short-patch-repair endonuclease
MRCEIDAQLEVIAALHAGAFSMAHVRDAGGDRKLAKRRVDAGRWLRRAGGTFVLAGVPGSLDQERHLALLAAGPGARLTHESAAELHGLEGVLRRLLVITVPHDHRLQLPGVTVHRIDDHDPTDLTVVDRFPTTTAARTLLDLAAVVSPKRHQRATEHAIAERLTTYGQLAEVLGRTRRQGKTGVNRFVATLEELDGKPPAASELERHLERVALMAGVRGVRQFPLPWDTEPVVGCVDLAVPESRLLLEADGRRWHARLEAMERDRRRDRAALRAGWETLRFMYRDLVDDQRGAMEDIRAIHQRRLAA